MAAPALLATTSPALGDLLLERRPDLRHVLDEDHAQRWSRRWAAQAYPDATVIDVRVGSVLLRPDGGCTARYEVRLASGSRPLARTLLVEAARGGEPVVQPFPDDPGLPTLARAVDPVGMRQVLCHTVPGTGRERGVNRCVVHVVHHPRQGPCVLRYTLLPGAAGSAEVRHPTVFGKVYPDARGADAAAGALRLLRRDLPMLPGGRRIVVPRPLGVVRELHLGLAEAVGGRPLLPGLLRTAVQTGEATSSLHAAVVTAGEVAAAVHASGAPTGERMAVRDLDGERAETQAQLAAAAGMWPDVIAEVDRRVGDQLPTAPAPQPVLAHGDFTPGQLLLDGDQVALVDVDTLCLADPARDLGRFLAYLHVAGVRRGGVHAWPLLEALTAEFVAAYRRGRADDARPDGDEALLDRVAAYRILTLGRMAAGACWQLKDARLTAVLGVLDAGDGWMRRVS